MLHPFSGVSSTENTTANTPVVPQPSRRDALGTMVFAAGTLAVPALASAQIAVTDALNEAGAPAPAITTLALNEEGALTRAVGEAGGRVLPAVTTEPFGEEAGRVLSRLQPGLEDGGTPVGKPIDQPMTQAIPEEGRATTLAIGEEGGRKPGPQVTTEALNEEGANDPAVPPAPLTRAINEQGGARPQITSLKGGEEGAGAPAPAQLEQAVPAVAAVAVAQIAVAQPAQASTEAVGEEGAQVIGKPIQIQIQPLPPVQATTLAIGEEAATNAVNEAGATTRALNEEGALTKAANEAGINLGGVVNVQPMSRDLSEAQLKAVFADLGSSDPGKALQASAILYGSRQVLPFLKANLKFEQAKVDSNQVARLVKDLDSDDFETREKAEQALEKLGSAVAGELKAALESKETSTEVKMRAQRLMDKFKDNSPVRVAERGVEVLVALNTAESKALLEALAKGPDNDLVVPAARKALERVKK